jgi:hypothetical protein
LDGRYDLGEERSMKLTWYPRSLIVVVMFLAAFAAALELAMDFRRGAIVGVLALTAYLALETILTFNPAQR